MINQSQVTGDNRKAIRNALKKFGVNPTGIGIAAFGAVAANLFAQGLAGEYDVLDTDPSVEDKFTAEYDRDPIGYARLALEVYEASLVDELKERVQSGKAPAFALKIAEALTEGLVERTLRKYAQVEGLVYDEPAGIIATPGFDGDFTSPGIEAQGTSGGIGQPGTSGANQSAKPNQGWCSLCQEYHDEVPV